MSCNFYKKENVLNKTNTDGEGLKEVCSGVEHIVECLFTLKSGVKLWCPDEDYEKTICPNNMADFAELNEKRKSENKMLNILSEDKKNFTFDSFDERINSQTNYIFKCKEFLNSEVHRTLILYGQNGTGKTHLGEACLNYISSKYGKKFKVYLIHSNDLYRMFVDHSRSGYSKQHETYYEIEEIINSHLVMIDDIGKEVHTESKVFNIGLLDYLEKKKSKLIITMNQNPKSMVSKYDKTITSRLLNKSIGMEFKGIDQRLKK